MEKVTLKKFQIINGIGIGAGEREVSADVAAQLRARRVLVEDAPVSETAPASAIAPTSESTPAPVSAPKRAKKTAKIATA